MPRSLKYSRRLDDSLERPLTCESADMDLINDEIAKRYPRPAVILPRECTGVDYPGRTVDALRLGPRCRVRTGKVIVEEVEVEPTNGYVSRYSVEVAHLVLLQRDLSSAAVGRKYDRGPFPQRRPNFEAHNPLADDRSP